jgi:poly-beta-1,6-N-acetyl-D-glucosamine synthase
MRRTGYRYAVMVVTPSASTEARLSALHIDAIVPFLNEELFLPAFLESIERQTRRLDRLVLVDDGSTDGSHAIAAEFADRHGWAVALRRSVREQDGDRLARAAEYAAFQWALAQVDEDWDVVAKLDADIRLTPRTVETIAAELERDPGLGLAGSYLSEVGASGVLGRLTIRPEHVHGATKFYRRECYEAISPMPAILGWDMIDEVKATMAGWGTRSFAMPDGDPLHMRVRGSHDGLRRGFRRWGEGAWAMGEHPLHVVLHGFQRMQDPPRVVGGLNYMVGWASAGLRRLPRAEPEVRANVRRGQLERIGRRLSRGGRRPSATPDSAAGN